MDNWIPDIGGCKTSRLLKDSDTFRHIPVIFFSDNIRVNKLAVEARADLILQKPLAISELENIVVNTANGISYCVSCFDSSINRKVVSFMFQCSSRYIKLNPALAIRKAGFRENRVAIIPL